MTLSPSPLDKFTGFVKTTRIENGLIELVFATDLSHPKCHHKAIDIATRQPANGVRNMGFFVTDREAHALHRGT